MVQCLSAIRRAHMALIVLSSTALCVVFAFTSVVTPQSEIEELRSALVSLGTDAADEVFLRYRQDWVTDSTDRVLRDIEDRLGGSLAPPPEWARTRFARAITRVPPDSLAVQIEGLKLADLKDRLIHDEMLSVSCAGRLLSIKHEEGGRVRDMRGHRAIVDITNVEWGEKVLTADVVVVEFGHLRGGRDEAMSPIGRSDLRCRWQVLVANLAPMTSISFEQNLPTLNDAFLNYTMAEAAEKVREGEKRFREQRTSVLMVPVDLTVLAWAVYAAVLGVMLYLIAHLVHLRTVRESSCPSSRGGDHWIGAMHSFWAHMFNYISIGLLPVISVFASFKMLMGMNNVASAALVLLPLASSVWLLRTMRSIPATGR